MSYIIKKAVPGDAEEVAEIMQVSIPLMPRILVEYQDVASEEIRRWNVASKRCYFETCERFPEELCALKVVVCGPEREKEEIVGYAVWGWTSGAMSRLQQARAEANIPYPRNGNTALNEVFYSRLRAMEARRKPAGNFYTLLFLLTSPTHQRRGVGARLVSYGLIKAAKDGVPVYLSASPMGLPLYKKLGFQELDGIEIDLWEYGWKGTEGRIHIHGVVAMIKEPAKEQETIEGCETARVNSVEQPL